MDLTAIEKPTVMMNEERARRNQDVVGRLLDSLLRYWL